MDFKKFVVFTFLSLGVFIANGQELQFNQWQFAPALLNPSLTGAYAGSFRAGAIVKDKWGSWSSRSYKTLEAYVDAPIVRGLRKTDWIGVGIAFDVDQAGFLKFSQQYQRMSLAYHMGFGKKYKNVFTIGGQYTSVTQSVTQREGITTESSILGGDLMEISSLLTGMQNDPSYNSWTASFGFKSDVNKKATMRFGLSLSQFLDNNNAVVGGIDELPARYTGFFSFSQKIGKRALFEPQVVYSKQGPNDKIYLQSIFGYLLKKDLIIKYGIGANLTSAFSVPLYTGVDYKNLRVGLSYAIDLGAIQATGSYGGVELGVSYIHILAKKPDLKPVIICPRL